jgi:VanZ family protein
MRKLLYWLAPFYTLLIAYGSLIDRPPLTGISIANIDKVYHGLAYMGMMFFWYLFFYHRFLEKQVHFNYNLRTIITGWSSTIAIAAALFSMIIGGLMELGQGFYTTNRTMDALDMLANTTGIIIATFILWIAPRFLK